MRYESIHKYFLVGLIIAGYMLVQGYIIIFSDVNIFILKILYMIGGLLMINWYYMQYHYFKGRYVDLKEDKMIVHIEEDDYSILNENIDGIFVLHHRSPLKIHHVIHMFTKDDEYFCFTTNIDHFSAFKQALSDKYSNQYYERKETCSVNLLVNKNNLYRLFFGDRQEVLVSDTADIIPTHMVHHI